MEINDELMTPGCPQCAIKHLSAAIALEAANVGRLWDDRHCIGAEAQVLVARAYVNYVEAAEGYESHANYARGLMVLAEEMCCGGAEGRRRIRGNRLQIDEHPETYRLADLCDLFCFHAEIAAHVEEARRELPSFDWDRVLATSGSVPRSAGWELAIREIRAEYFDLPDKPEKGGEEDMACCAKKAKKAACKGGACAAKVPAKKAAKKGKK